MIWLPPSEGKTAPASGPVLDLTALSLPVLTAQREEVARALVEVSGSPAGAEVLHLGPRSLGDLAVNTHLWESPCAPAREVFTGVLFEAAGLDGQAGVPGGALVPPPPDAAALVPPPPDAAAPDPAAPDPAAPEVWIFSGLLGVLRPGDLVPDHRLPMGTRLPEVGPLASFWRPHLDAALSPAGTGATVVDLRSGPYRSACPAPWAHVLRVEVVREQAGVRRVVSHQAKHWRGLVCAELLAARTGTALPDDVHSCVDTIRSGTARLRARDVQGHVQRVRDVEVSPARSTRQGGSLTTLTLVVEQS